MRRIDRAAIWIGAAAVSLSLAGCSGASTVDTGSALSTFLTDLVRQLLAAILV